MLGAVLGANVKLVSGYPDTANIRQAADAGEVHGGCWAWESVKVTWKAGLEAGDVVVIGGHRAAANGLGQVVEVADDVGRGQESQGAAKICG